jgi:chorismate dehydratase
MLKLGVVPYLNALPLYKTLEARDDIGITAAVPSQLSRVLDEGEVDVALLPVVEHFRGVGESFISSSCIACTREVRSVLLFSRVPFESIQSVALDMSSRTSVALTKVILADSFGLSPSFHDAPPDLENMLRECESALLIGDPALIAVQNLSRDANHQLRVLDLGEAWFQLTQLPFVFAAWVSRRNLQNADEIARLLDNTREDGMSQIAQLARDAAQTSELSQGLIESYYRNAIEYSMTAAHRQGLEEFRRRCAIHNLLDSTL